MFKRPAVRGALQGGIGFGAVSLAVFATVAFGERWMYRNLGLWGAYLAWTALFVLLGGVALGPLAPDDWRRGGRFFVRFFAAFFAYASAWTAAYFLVRGPAGEWLGALLGPLALGGMLAGSRVAWGRAVWVLLPTHAAGYFLGSWANATLGGPVGMLAWGALYGIGFGVGMGATLAVAPRSTAA